MSEKVKAIQVRLTEDDWRFIRRLAVDRDTTISEIFRNYIAYLRRGGELVGFTERERR